MGRIIFYWLIIIFISAISHYSMANDTLVKSVYTSSVFYNFGKDGAGRLYVGASDGLYEIKANTLIKLNKESGYVVINNDEITRSTYFGVENNYNFRNILPANYGKFPHQSFLIKDHIYLICNGSLFFYEIKKYSVLLKGKSVRSFSDNSVGTYDGIYIYGEKIKLPTYTSGSIYEVDSTFYICYDGLAIYLPNGKTNLLRRISTGETQIANENLGDSRALLQFKDGNFLITSTKGLHLIDSLFASVNTVYQSLDNKAPVIINMQDSEHQKVISFTAANTLYNYNLQQKEIFSLDTFKSEIKDGIKDSNTIKNCFVLLFKDEILVYSKMDGKQEITVGLKDAHSIISLGKDIYLISTQNGVHLFYLDSNEISQKLFEGVEFNRDALWYRDDTIKLGTTNGYILIAKNELLQMAKKNDAITKNVEHSNYLLWLIVVSFILIIGVLFFLFKKRSLSIINDVRKVTRLDIEEYIQLNLNSVSIDALTDQFSVSNKTLYKITAPDKPGTIISSFRKTKAKELIAEGKSINIVSEVTGFSVSYLRKIKS